MGFLELFLELRISHVAIRSIKASNCIDFLSPRYPKEQNFGIMDGRKAGGIPKYTFIQFSFASAKPLDAPH